jgi:hypothetical protein
MRLLTITVATATVFTLALSQTPQVLAHDDGAVGPILRLDGGPSLGPDNRGQTGARSETTQPSAGTKSEKAQSIEKSSEATSQGLSHTHISLRSHAKHRFAFHGRGHHMMAFHMPRHRFVIHRHGRRFV